MAGMDQTPNIGALDGTVDAVRHGKLPQKDHTKDVSLPTRPKPNGGALSTDSLPQPGNALTGKQEHCTRTPTSNLEALLILQISRGSCCLNKSTLRSQSWHRPPPSSALVLPSAPTTEKLPPLTPICPSYASSSFTMFATFLSSIKRGKRNSGRTSCRW